MNLQPVFRVRDGYEHDAAPRPHPSAEPGVVHSDTQRISDTLLLIVFAFHIR